MCQQFFRILFRIGCFTALCFVAKFTMFLLFGFTGFVV